MRLDRGQRFFVADKLMDTANFAVGGLVFGQLVARQVDILVLILGVTLYSWLWSISVRLKKGVGK